MSRADTRSSRPDRGGQGRDRRHGGADRHQVAVDGDPSARELVYGRNAVRETVRGRRAVHAVFLSSSRDDENAGISEQQILDWCREAGKRSPKVIRITARELSARLQTPDHQGIAVEVDSYCYTDEKGLLAQATLLVALDSVQDPHNLGAVIRSAEACGAGVVIPRHRAVEVTPAVVKASAGATEHAAVAKVRNLSDFLSAAKAQGFWVYGAAAEAGSDYSSQDYVQPSCFVMGSEGRGLGKRVASLCDFVVSLPQMGQVGSLNVSVSAGVLLYEALRQRGVRQQGQAR